MRDIRPVPECGSRPNHYGINTSCVSCSQWSCPVTTVLGTKTGRDLLLLLKSPSNSHPTFDKDPFLFVLVTFPFHTNPRIFSDTSTLRTQSPLTQCLRTTPLRPVGGGPLTGSTTDSSVVHRNVPPLSDLL